MSKKSGKTAQVAETKKQKSVEVPKDPLLEPIVIPENIRKTAKEMGVDVGAIADRANLIQNRIVGIETAIMSMAKAIDQRDEKLAPLVNLAKQIEERQKMVTQVPQQQIPQQSGGGGGTLLSIFDRIAGTSEPDPLTKVLHQEIVRAGIENMFMGSALVKTMIAKVAPDMYAEAIKKAKETLPKTET